MPVEVLPSSVIDRRGPRICMASSDLDITEWDPGIKCRHDERRSEHVRVDSGQPRLLAERAHPAVSSAPVQALAVLPPENRALVALTDSEVDGPSGPWHQRNSGWLASFAHDPKGAMTLGEGEVLDIGSARLTDAETVEAKQHGEGGMITVESLGCEQEGPELRSVESPTL